MLGKASCQGEGETHKVRLPGGGFLARQRVWEKQRLGLIKQHRKMPGGESGREQHLAPGKL